jgi:pantoate--beta-alanine ligase
VPGLTVDYLEVRDAELGPARAGEPGRLLVAARVGNTRLLDNIAIEIGTSPAPVGPDGYTQSARRN